MDGYRAVVPAVCLFVCLFVVVVVVVVVVAADIFTAAASVAVMYVSCFVSIVFLFSVFVLALTPVLWNSYVN